MKIRHPATRVQVVKETEDKVYVKLWFEAEEGGWFEVKLKVPKSLIKKGRMM